MLSFLDLERLKERITEVMHPDKIYLFGSYANGNATDESDVDILVVMDSELPPHKRNVAVKRLFPQRTFSLDAFVYTPQEFARYKDIPGTLIYNAAHYGRLLHG
ncbi:nucleotidyltransferase, putative [Geotalea daltonii FRC-32]|uniref:Nucleotidyltransferase, putative n=1 Tax=Geotalea daltonii (strain DSM 22248 / JCM 15807 / FRC-32) TaxID=316067 RepID=B9M382_GEODF|nr:nucleotidyltransferase domain-containing protein [Geotalea daltonii]ACM19492.1 nucleotidyltransferase, putative [Geotalea daltonii FRC-32]